MTQLLRALWGIGWRVAVSLLSFYACAVGGEALQQLRGSYHTPTSWAISLALCFFTFCLVTVGLAIAFQMRTTYSRPMLLAGASVLYTVAALYWCGALFGLLERPYRLAWIICCGLAGLAAPWLLERISMRVIRLASFRVLS
jgi:hypothetical protein